METAGVEPAPPRCKRGALPLELHPRVGRTECGRMESNHHSAKHRVYSAGSSPLLSVRMNRLGQDLHGPRSGPFRGLRAVENLLLRILDLALIRWPTGFEPAPTGLTTPGASVTPRPPRSGDDRTRTGGLSPDKRALCSSELRPRRVRGWDSNPRSRAHEAREDNRSSTAQSGRQESNLRSPAPEAGGVAFSPTARCEQRAPPAGFEPAASGLRARRHRRFDHRGRRLRRQGSNLPLAVNSRASFRLDHAGTNERKERESNPQGSSEPTRFRDGIPRRWQSFQVTPAGVEPAPSRVRIGSSAELSYGASM